MKGGGHNEEKFKAAILSMSVSKHWDDAKAEWQLFLVYIDPEPGRSCICEHTPINQICIIYNTKTSCKTEVGNVCVKRFLRLLSQRILSVIKRVRLDNSKSLNLKALELFRDRGVISSQEEKEYAAYWKKRISLTDKEKRQKLDINRRVLSYIDTETPKLIAHARSQGLDI